MNRIIGVLVIILFTINSIVAENIKNVILLIPDGTSLSVLSAARWYQQYNNPEKTGLNIDPYLCGTIRTFSSNAPIGDSAPTTSCYMTGYPSQSGFVAMYPTADPINDIFPINPDKAYQPLMTILEAARITQNKSTGLVVTCDFPNATPADCSAHSHNRGKYEWIAPQMVHNKLDIMLGGGAKYLSENDKQFLNNEGYGVFVDDINGFRNYKGNKIWALFGEINMAFEIDRDPELEPSLAEMTKFAIEKLSKNKNGFFLMVEGSKIDWAAHGNDAAALITEMLAFDEACGVAINFAKADGKTVVVVVPDHGTGGFSIGSKKCPDYFSLTKDQLFGTVSNIKTSIIALVNKLKNTEHTDLEEVFKNLIGIPLKFSDYIKFLQCWDYNLSPLSDEERNKELLLFYVIADIIDRNTCFGFTSEGHTGEEVFLAVLDPTKNRLTGHHSNIELHNYLLKVMGFNQSLESLTNEYFAKHTEVFKNYSYEIINKNDIPVLEIKKDNFKLIIQPNTNIVKLNEKEIKLNSVVVYVDENKTFYLPRSLSSLLIKNK